jgi:hypothetical protein
VAELELDLRPLIRLPSPSDEEAVSVTLLRHYVLGEVEPVWEELAPLPSTAPLYVQKVYALFRVCYGLRLVNDDPRPVPLSCRWVAGVLGLSTGRVSRALRLLWRVYRVLGPPVKLPPLGGRNRGTHAYLPHGARRVEADRELDGRPAARPKFEWEPGEPAVESGDDLLVPGTKFAVADGTAATVGDGAGAGVHGPDGDTPLGGG